MGAKTLNHQWVLAKKKPYKIGQRHTTTPGKLSGILYYSFLYI